MVGPLKMIVPGIGLIIIQTIDGAPKKCSTRLCNRIFLMRSNPLRSLVKFYAGDFPFEHSTCK
jgi:hypothetical protein